MEDLKCMYQCFRGTYLANVGFDIFILSQKIKLDFILQFHMSIKLFSSCLMLNIIFLISYSNVNNMSLQRFNDIHMFANANAFLHLVFLVLGLIPMHISYLGHDPKEKVMLGFQIQMETWF